MTAQQIEQARLILQREYDVRRILKRSLTSDEVIAEVASIVRKARKGTLDNQDQHIESCLSGGRHPVDWNEFGGNRYVR